MIPDPTEIGKVTVRLPRVIGMGGALAAAQELARQIAAFPQQCVPADRRSAYEQWDLSLAEALRREGAQGTPMVFAERLPTA